MRRKQKHFILILYVEIQSRFLSLRKKYIIQELTDSTLVFQYLPDSLTMGVGSVKCVTDNSIEGQRKNEERLDSIWRKEEIWNMGVTMITGVTC